MANRLSTEQYKKALLTISGDLAHAIENITREDLDGALLRVDEVKATILKIQACDIVENFRQ